MSISRPLSRKFDGFFVLVVPIIALVLSFWLRAPFLLTAFFFFAVPALWLSVRNPKHIKKTFIFSLVLSQIPYFILVYLAALDEAWFLSSTVFPFRLPGKVVLEEMLYIFASCYFVVIFYKHFCDDGKTARLSRYFKYLVLIVLAELVSFLILITLFNQLLPIPYVYIWALIIFSFIPLGFFLSRFPRFLKKFLIPTIYFIFLGILLEFTAIMLGQTQFPGQHFIGWLDWGLVRLPIEEFLTVCVFMAPTTLMYYKLFADDRKSS